MYTTALEVLRTTGVVQASQLTGIPISTIRDVVGSVEETGTVAPKKRGRKEGTGTLFTVESMERFQDFIDEHPESTLKEMKDFFEERFGVSPTYQQFQSSWESENYKQDDCEGSSR